jgi:hypothetical protein
MGDATDKLRNLVGSYYRRTPSGALIRVKGYVRGPAEESDGRNSRGIRPPRAIFSPDPATGDGTKEAVGYLLPVPKDVLDTVRSAHRQSQDHPADPQIAAALLYAAGQHSITQLRRDGISEDVLEILQRLLHRPTTAGNQ